MERDLFDIEDLFKSALSDMRQTPPERVWDSIDTRLNKEAVTHVERKYERVKRYSYLLLLLLVGFGVYVLMQMNSESGVSSNLATTALIPKDVAKYSNRKQQAVNVSANTTLNSGNKVVSNINASAGIGKTQSVATLQKTFGAVSTRKNIIVSDEISTLPAAKMLAQKSSLKNNRVLSNEDANADLHNTSMDLNGAYDDKMGTGWKSLSGEQVNLIDLANSFDNASINTVDVAVPHSIALNTNYSNKAAAKNASSIQRLRLPKGNRFSLTGFYSPDKQYYYLRNLRSEDKTNSIKNSEEHLASSTYGILLDYKVRRRVSIEMGVAYSSLSTQSSSQTIYSRKKGNEVAYRFDISSGWTVFKPGVNPSSSKDSVEINNAIHQLNYIKVPIALKYDITTSRLRLQAMGGLGINFLTSNKLEATLQKENADPIHQLVEIEGLNKRFYDAIFGIGAEYLIRRNVSFVFMPTGRYALTAVNKSGVAKTFPRSVSFMTGLRYSF